ncbi:hypothetical protein ACQPW1_05490 [Nocardia sp. CA-128927]|uniref:hypothetical protein n=1 Tax=Nocardia sp. CA-128927 TaxID=3239975 RepID=UPI003D9668D0
MRDEQSTGSSEIAALAQRVETARGKLPLQHDAALFEVLSESEIGAERELAEWVRAQRRKQRRRSVEEELAAEKRDRRSAAVIRRSDEADERWHRRALAARRRVSSEDARLAQLYRRAEWSSRALIAVVVLGMVWAGVNVQHNLVPSGDMSDPLYWLSYGIEAMISIPIITIMVAATTAARWGRELARGKVVFFETALLGTTIALNAGPHLASGSFGRAAEYAIAPVMVGVVIWLHAWVSARYALLIDGAPVVDRDATVVRHRVSDRESHVGLTVDAPDDRRWLLSGVDPYAATTAAGLHGADSVGGFDRQSDQPLTDHAVAPSTNGHAVQSFSGDAAPRLSDADDGHDSRSAANGYAVQAVPVDTAGRLPDVPVGYDSRPATNGHAVRSFSADTAHQPLDAPSDSRPPTNGHAVSADNRHADRPPVEAHEPTNGSVAVPFSTINGHQLPVELRDPRSAGPVDNPRSSVNGIAAQPDSANSFRQEAVTEPGTAETSAQPSPQPAASSNGHRSSANGQVGTNGHAAINGHAVANGHSATNGHAVTDSRPTSPTTNHTVTDGHAVTDPATSGHPVIDSRPTSPTTNRAVTNGHALTDNHRTAPTNGHPATNNGQAAPTDGHAVTNSQPVVDTDPTSSTNGQPVMGINHATPTNGDAALTNGHALDGGRVAPTNGDAALNGHAMQLFPVSEVPRRLTEPGTVAPAPDTTADAHRGDQPEEPHPSDAISKAAATIADAVAQAISGETAARPSTGRRKSAAPSVADAEIEQLVFDENPEPPRPTQRTEPASIVGRIAAEPEVEPELLDDEDEIDEDDEITALAHEIARRGMSNLSVEQLTQIFRLADESWLTPGIANEVGVSRAAVARAVEAGIKVRRPYAISG